MNEASELRRRAARWRATAEVTRTEMRTLRTLATLTWRGESAGAFREVLGRRVRELGELADREDAVADLLDRVAAVVEQAA
ncbi:hypothetical protein [Knoellia aerolata]|uniref:Uncharacterized protein n=1 Tax=Knoellia aerolata DSM 18566 TaxID=1385519 RepID=A0A0A0K105_9MICO|nr:hypothetical protein [Knoellia aerolata]KGN43123.1 hypothetical protein N801_04865 [Knoellia aerolata DSM 18566]